MMILQLQITAIHDDLQLYFIVIRVDLWLVYKTEVIYTQYIIWRLNNLGLLA